MIIGINYNFIVKQLRLKLLLIIGMPKVKKLQMGQLILKHSTLDFCAH